MTVLDVDALKLALKSAITEYRERLEQQRMCGFFDIHHGVTGRRRANNAAIMADWGNDALHLPALIMAVLLSTSTLLKQIVVDHIVRGQCSLITSQNCSDTNNSRLLSNVLSQSWIDELTTPVFIKENCDKPVEDRAGETEYCISNLELAVVSLQQHVERDLVNVDSTRFVQTVNDMECLLCAKSALLESMSHSNAPHNKI